MKLRSFIMFSAAALAFAACSNEEDFGTSAAIEGEATIRVNIAEAALSRAIPVADYTTSEEVTLNSIKLVLTAQQGGAEKVFKIADFANSGQAMLEAVNEFEFTGVRNPSKMEVFINTEKSSGWTPEDFVDAGLAEPLYDSEVATNFVNKGDMDEDGITEYEVALEPEHTMARLEFGGIKHVDTAGKKCMFSTIQIDGVMLDGVAGVTEAEAWDVNNLMSSPAINEDFAKYNEETQSPVWPANNQCYAFNIAPVTSGELPTLKVCFSNITINTTDYAGTIWPTNGLGYATVKNYKLDEASAAYKEAFGAGDDNVITKFPAGYIYQVKSLEIPDEAIGQGWQGGEDVHIYAVVTVKAWTIATGTVEWN